MARDINLGPTGGPFVNIQENSGDLDITGATDVDLNGANLTNGGIKEGFDTIDVFTADGTFDSSNIDKAIVEVVGGGGGGGYRPTPSGAYTDMPASGGGGGGGYAKSLVDLSTTSSVSITVGAGGAGGTSSSIDGSNGGGSSFGSSVTANGGSGGSGAVEGNTAAAGGRGGTSTGTISVRGSTGESGYTTGSVVVSGNGGGTQLSQVNVLDPKVASSNPSSVSQLDPGYGAGGCGDIFDGASLPGEDGVVIVYY